MILSIERAENLSIYPEINTPNHVFFGNVTDIISSYNENPGIHVYGTVFFPSKGDAYGTDLHFTFDYSVSQDNPDIKIGNKVIIFGSFGLVGGTTEKGDTSYHLFITFKDETDK